MAERRTSNSVSEIGFPGVPSHGVKGVVVVVGEDGSPGAVQWATGWAAHSGRALTVLREGCWVQIVAPHVSTIVLDALVAAHEAVAVPRAPAPRCPVLVLPGETSHPPEGAPVVVAVGGCPGCAVPLGFAFAHAQRLALPLHVVPLAGGGADDEARVHSSVAMLAACYPELAVTVAPRCGLRSVLLTEQARLVVTAVGVPGAGVQPHPDLVARARVPVALVSVAA